ncbi:MAG: YfhO family protein [Chitinivibrionales bacterium]|nr:YfhO family protein [Chitinivibrionales bacterium]
MATKHAKPAPKSAAVQPPARSGLGAFISQRSTLVALGLLGALTALFYAPILFQQGFLWNDFIEQNFPYRLFAATALKDGQFPFWNPYVFSGMPFFADVQAALLYPPNLLLTFFAGAAWLSPLLFEAQILCHIFLAAFFMYLCGREFGLARSGCLLAATTFMLCGFLSAHIFHVNLIHTAAWLPLIVLLAHRVLFRNSFLYGALLALTLAVAFLAGYPQLMLHFCYWLAAFFIYFLIVNIRGRTPARRLARPSALFGVSLALGIALCAVQLLPTNELAENSARPTMEYGQSCEGSLRPYRFITMLVPKYFGTPQQKPGSRSIYWGVDKNDVNPGIHSFWETACYLGILPLLLALLAAFFVRKPIVIFLVVMAVLALMLAMGDSFFLYHIAYSLLPGLNRFRVPARFMFLFSFSLSLLAGFGLGALIEQRLPAARKKTLFICGGIGIGLVTFWALLYSGGAFKNSILDFLLRSGKFGSDASGLGNAIAQSIYPAALQQIWIFVFFAWAAVLLIFLRFRGTLSARATIVGALCITALELFTYGYGYAAGPEDPGRVYAEDELVSELKQDGAKEFFRVNSRDSRQGDDLGGPNMLLRRNQGSVQHIFLMEGYNPLRLKREFADRKSRTLDMLNVKYKIATDPVYHNLGLALNPTYLPRCRMVYDYVVQTDPDSILPLLYRPSFNPVRTLIVEQKPPFAACPECGALGNNSSATITNYGLNRIDIAVNADRDGLLALAEIWYPAWRAKVDNKEVPLYRADYALRAIPVPAGSHTVTCYFRSDAFEKGLVISLVSLVFVIAMLGLGCLQNKIFGRGSTPKTP